MIKWAIAFTFFICFGKSFSQQRLDDFSFIYGDPIQVQLINKTGYNLDTVIYHNLFFPFIEKEDSTGFIAISNYTEGDFISGNVSGFNMDNTHWVYHCIPKKSKYSGKKLIIEMYLADSDMLPGRKRIKTRISKVLN